MALMLVAALALAMVLDVRYVIALAGYEPNEPIVSDAHVFEQSEQIKAAREIAKANRSRLRRPRASSVAPVGRGMTVAVPVTMCDGASHEM
jgi:hypothetical protein